MTGKRILKSLASLKLAVSIILSLATIVGVGTFVESNYSDANTAKKLVYDTVWMYSIMGLLAINLIAVMVDRWPWRPRHASFVLAHIGILFLLAGSVLTLRYGIDGSMLINIKDSARNVTLPETELIVYTSFDGSDYRKIFSSDVDFFSSPPRTEKPIRIPIDEGELVVDDFYKYAAANRLVVASQETGRGAGVRFQLTNGRANSIEWLVQRRPGENAQQDFGPARVVLGEIPLISNGRNEIYVKPVNDEEIEYALFHKETIDAFKKGRLKEGESLQTGWMGLEFRVLRYLPKAEEKWQIEKKERAIQGLTTSALKVTFQNRERWVLLNDVTKFFTPKAVYLFAYANKRQELPFSVFLKEFKVERYEGSSKAKEYSSLVTVDGGDEILISMNEPMKHAGLTFYQASFQDGPNGQPTATVLSVNYDPGRWLKYLGSLIMSLGIIMLFYFKQKARKIK